MAYTHCANSAAELRNDQRTVDPTPYMAEAINEIVDGVMSGQQVRGYRSRMDIQDAVSLFTDEDERDDMLARLLVIRDPVVLADLQSTLRDQLDQRLRARLAGSELAQDVAHRISREPRE